MRADAIVREATKDVLTGTARVLTLGLVYVCLIGILLLHELTSVIDLLDAADDYQARGANVHVVTAEGRIDGAACEALSADFGVDSAAVRALPGQLRVNIMQNVPLSQYAATPGIAAVLGVTATNGGPTPSGAFVGSPVLNEFGATTRLATNAGDIDIAGVYSYPDDGRREGYGYAVMLPEPVGEVAYDECWVRSWPEPANLNAMLSSVVLPAATADEGGPEFVQLNPSLGSSFDGASMFADRLSRFDGVAAVVFGAVLGFFAVRARRLELASARHAGVSTSALLRIQLLQHGVWLLLATAVLISFTLVAATTHSDSLGSLLGLGLRVILLGVPGAVAGITIAVVSIREHALFAFFKERS